MVESVKTGDSQRIYVVCVAILLFKRPRVYKYSAFGATDPTCRHVESFTAHDKTLRTHLER